MKGFEPVCLPPIVVGGLCDGWVAAELEPILCSTVRPISSPTGLKRTVSDTHGVILDEISRQPTSPSARPCLWPGPITLPSGTRSVC